jgi:hypothetical protein
MGHLGAFDVGVLMSKYKLDTFVETGTGAGNSMEHARLHGFRTLYSIEIMEPIFANASRRFAQFPNCILINATSEEGLRTALKAAEQTSGILFWLDAHFPGADYGLAGYGDVADKRIRIPLEQELLIIREMRSHSRDVILIDDLRIYEDGPFQNGNWSERCLLGDHGIGFIERLYSPSHQIRRDYREEGYLILEPLP